MKITMTLSGDWAKGVAREAVRALLRFFFRYFHQLEARGTENVPATGPVVLISNHGSYYDPVIIRVLLRRRVCFMTWADVLSWPVVGRLARAFGAFPVDLDRRQDVDAFRGALQVLKDGHVLGIFPEGGRAPGPLMQEIKLGGVRIAVRAKAPIVPVSIVGVHDIWPRRRRFPQPGRIAITFHPPMQVGCGHHGTWGEEREHLRQLMTEVCAVINAEVATRLRVWIAQGCIGSSAGRLRSACL